MYEYQNIINSKKNAYTLTNISFPYWKSFLHQRQTMLMRRWTAPSYPFHLSLHCTRFYWEVTGKPKKAIWLEQDECGFTEFEPYSFERENFHVCWSTGTHLCLHVEYRILHSSTTSINIRCCNKYLREYNATTRFK